MGEHVEPPAVRDSDDDLGSAVLGGELDGLENCFWPMNARRRNISKASTCESRSRSRFRSSGGSGLRNLPVSIAWRSQTRSA